MESTNPNASNSEALIPPGISTLCLTRDFQITEKPLFICDGSLNHHYIECEKKITIYGLGFLGPIENDGFYDVKVQLEGWSGIVYDSGMLEKRIFAQKGKQFYFVLDTPINLEAGSVSGLMSKYYRINYYLKGANTFACNRVLQIVPSVILEDGDTKFRLEWRSKQLSEILFKVV